MAIRFSTFPRTQTPPRFLAELIAQFEAQTEEIGTIHREKGLTSNEVLAVLQPGLIKLGFEVESGRRTEDKIKRPVLFGENAQPELQYEIDAWHPVWQLASRSKQVERGWAMQFIVI